MSINIISKTPEDISSEIKYQEGAIISKVILKSDELNITLFAVAKGQEFSKHTTTSKAIVHIVEGTGEFMLDEKWHNFQENDYFFMEENLVHAIKAKSDFKFLLYLF